MSNARRSKRRSFAKLMGWDDIRKPSIACEKAWTACLRAKEHRYQSLKSRELLLQLYRALQQRIRGWKTLEAEQRGMEDLTRQVERLGLSTTVLPCRTGKEKVVIFRALFQGVCSGIQSIRKVSKILHLPDVTSPRAAGVMSEVVVYPKYSLSLCRLLREPDVDLNANAFYTYFTHKRVRNGKAAVFPVVFASYVTLHDVGDWAELMNAKLVDVWCLLAFAQTSEGKRLKQAVHTQYWPESIVQPFHFAAQVQDLKLRVTVDECTQTRIYGYHLMGLKKPRRLYRTHTPKSFSPGTFFLLQTKD